MKLNRLAYCRLCAGLSQKQIAELLGVGQTTVSAWERGQNESDLATACLLASFYNVSVPYLFGYERRRGLYV